MKVATDAPHPFLMPRDRGPAPDQPELGASPAGFGEGEKTVAIICQGGGSLTAFTAGVLSQLLNHSKLWEKRRLVALSGTSGGALCAAVAWSALTVDEASGQQAKARLKRLWDLLTFPLNPHYPANQWGVAGTRLSPVWLEGMNWWLSTYTCWFLTWTLKTVLQAPYPPVAAPPVALFIGATDITNGAPVVFGNNQATVERLVASASVPPLFLPKMIDHRPYWDGLFTTNPPLAQMVEALAKVDATPDEVWLIRINPIEYHINITSFPAQVDRRNELAGNIAYAGEVTAVQAQHPHIQFRDIDLPIRPHMDFYSKFDVNPVQAAALWREGELAAVRHSNAVLGRRSDVPPDPVGDAALTLNRAWHDWLTKAWSWSKIGGPVVDPWSLAEAWTNAVTETQRAVLPHLGAAGRRSDPYHLHALP